MDTGFEDPEDESAALASFLGFSSFGTQKPAAKKRKFNSKTDAFVEGQELESIDRGGKKGRGSGGNNIPLGKQRALGEKAGRGGRGGNEDEIDLDDEEGGVSLYQDTSRSPPIIASSKPTPKPTYKLNEADEESDIEPAYIDTSLPPPASTKPKTSASGPPYIDTSFPPPLTTISPSPTTSTIPDPEAAEMQVRIDRILSSLESAPPPPGVSSSVLANLPPPPGLGMGIPPPPGTNLPNRPAFAPEQGQGRGRGRGPSMSDTASSFSGSGSGSGRGGPRGQRNELWYVGYYDPNFNENPWEALEKERGFGSVGTWVERARR